MVALSLPPWGWWPLGVAGLGLAAWAVGDSPRLRAQLAAGLAFGLGQFVVGFWWMAEFSLPGSVLVMLLETSFVTLAFAASPTPLALPAALVLAEAARGEWPLEGLPMAGAALGQAGGPLLHVARVAGALGVLAVAGAAGSALAHAARRRWRAAAALAAVAVSVTALGAVAPDGGGGGTIRLAAVQGGGPRGFRAVDTDAAEVFDRHVAATAGVRPPVDLVVWPEDVVDVEDPVAETPEGEALAGLARSLGVPVLAGVVEGAGPRHFRNAAVVWGPGGVVTARYEKVHRVPFGEYIPARGLVSRVADVSAVPADAIPGRGTGAVDAGPARLGVTISFEVYFADRARGATRDGGRLLVVPTNAASFSTSQVPTTQVATARLRAVENGRDLVQAAPTGYSAFVDNRGHVLRRSTLGRRQVLHGSLTTRSGTTVYTRTGDWPVVLLAAAVVMGAWVSRRRAWR